MKVFANSVVILAAAALGLLAGFAWSAKNGRASLGLAARDSRSTGLSAPASPDRHLRRRLDDSPLATELEHDLTRKRGVARWLCWLEAIEKAAPSDFPRLALLAKDDPAALQFVAVHWAQIAPRHLFDYLAAATKNGRGPLVQELARVLFQDWPKQDPEGAIAALSEPGAAAAFEPWKHQVATTVIKNDIERGLRLFSEWHINNYMPFYDERGPIPKWAAANPRHAAEFALQYPSDYLTQGVIKVVGEEWAKIDPAAALKFSADTAGQMGALLGTAALKSWAERDLGAAADWLASANDPARNRLSPGFVEAWAKSDASGALAWSQDNLSGSTLSKAVSAVVQGAGVKQVAATAGLVAALDPSPARAEGAVAVARQWFPSLGGMAGPSGNQNVTPETVAWLSSLDPVSIKRVLDEETWSWATSDPGSMANFLLSITNQSMGDWPERCLARQMAQKNPAGALDWAGQLPGNRALVAGGEAYAQWWSSQPDAATQWLNGLAAEDARRQPFFESAIQLIAYNPQAPEQLAAMNPDDRAAAKKVIERMTSLPAENRARLLAGLTAP